ncbi:unnamed protein product [Cuscuta epithymum]|uniref:Uncharacterized protein n=1 Tax=Cuscuta epithymum TaxID=186058 RepID=A0AAV0DZQ2_9ASTE|nr:unnamed protein product [Cuscuta epithymum]
MTYHSTIGRRKRGWGGRLDGNVKLEAQRTVVQEAAKVVEDTRFPERDDERWSVVSEGLKRLIGGAGIVLPFGDLDEVVEDGVKVKQKGISRPEGAGGRPVAVEVVVGRDGPPPLLSPHPVFHHPTCSWVHPTSGNQHHHHHFARLLSH